MPFLNFLKIFCLVVCLAGVAARAQTAEPRLLDAASPVGGAIGDGEKRSFKIAARAGEFVRVVVEQTNADISLRAFAPDNSKIYDADNSDTRTEAERVSFIAAAGGEYRIEIEFVRSLPGRAAGDDYEIQLTAVRAPTAADTAQIEAEKLYDRGNLLRFERKAESRRAALGVFAESLPHFRRAGDRAAEARVFYAIGQVNSLLSDFPASIENYAKARAIFRELNLRPQLARATVEEATIHNVRDDYARANELCLAALDIFRALGDRRGEAEITGNLGVLANRQNEPRRALEFFFQALPILQAMRDRKDEARILRSVGLTYDYLGEPARAVEFYEKAIVISRELKDFLSVANALTNFGQIQRSLGDNTRAIESYTEALEILRRQGDKRGEAAILNNLGVVYEELGEGTNARGFYEKSLALRRELKLREAEITVISNLANLELAAGRPAQAQAMFTEVLQFGREAKNKRTESRALVKLGEAAQKSGEAAKALEFFNSALPLLREIEDRDWEGLTLLLVGETHRQNNNFAAAREHLNAALKIKREMQTPLDQAEILLSLARVERAEKNLPAAQTAIETALEIVENLRARVSRQDLRASLFSSKQNFYEFYVDLLVAQGKNAEALKASERARARNLLESLGEARAEIRGANIAPELLEQEKNLRRLINAKDAQRINALRQKLSNNAAGFERELAELVPQYRAAQAEIRRQNPNFAALVAPEPLDAKQIQTEILDDDSILLEYFLAAENSFLFVADRGSLTVHRLPPAAEIETLARRFYENVKARGLETGGDETPATRAARLEKSDADAANSARELSRVLLAPAADKIQNKRLLIVASGVLQYVPFAALQSPKSKVQSAKSGNQFLIETNEIVTLPSASSLAALRKLKRGGAAKNLVAVLADPVFAADDARVGAAAKEKMVLTAGEVNAKKTARPRLRADFGRLRFSRLEAETIAAFAPAGRRFVALDFAANLNAATGENLSDSRVVHFATHGFVNSDFPELSGVVLSLVDADGKPQDGYLRLHDVYNLRLNADLVVLSACETALGKEIKGEGIVGLTRGFMYAGSRSVAASLWKVDDKATAELMRRFYQKMFAENLRPAAALRAAQIEMLGASSTRNPFFWAGFTLQGDWK